MNIIDDKLYGEIKEYCKINNLKISKFVNDILQKAFLIEKYGEAPFRREEDAKEHEDASESHDNEIKDKTSDNSIDVPVKSEEIISVETESVKMPKKGNKRRL